MRFVVGICLVAGCGQPMPPPAAPPPRAPAMFELPRAPYDVVPADLSEVGIVRRIPHRAIVRVWDRAAFVIGHGTQIKRDPPEDANVTLPVIGETERAARVVVEDDGARVAAWVPKTDLADTVLVPVQLADEGGSGVAVWAEPGIELVTRRPGVAYEVGIVDEALDIVAWVPKRAIDKVWIVKPGDAPLLKFGRRSDWKPPRDGRKKLLVEQRAPIRAHAGAKAPVIATMRQVDQTVSVIAEHGDVTEVEIARPHLRVRGFVAAAQLQQPPDDLAVHTTGGGHGFGMSHATTHQVPATTCLYDAPGGDVVGVTIVDQERLGGPVESGVWVQVYVNTPWEIAPLWMKNQGTPGLPAEWESCKDPGLRR